MRSDRDKRTDSEREIDEFLAQFETPVDELSADVNSYLDTTDTTKMTAARTFYGAEFKNAGIADVSAVSDGVTMEQPAESASGQPASEPAAEAAGDSTVTLASDISESSDISELSSEVKPSEEAKKPPEKKIFQREHWKMPNMSLE